MKGPQGHGRPFKGKVVADYVENVNEDASATPVIKDLAAQGHKLIFTTSFGYMDQTLEVAKAYPDAKFEHCTGYKHADNVATYNNRFHEGAPSRAPSPATCRRPARSAISAPSRFRKS